VAEEKRFSTWRSVYCRASLGYTRASKARASAYGDSAPMGDHLELVDRDEDAKGQRFRVRLQIDEEEFGKRCSLAPPTA